MYPLEFEFSPDICPEVGFLDHMAILFLVFKGTSVLFSIMSVPVYIPINSVGSLFSTSSPAFVICKLFSDGHFDQCEVVPHCSFGLYFSNNYQC